MAGGRIPVEQWCVTVHRSRAEETRRMLQNAGVLDRTLRPKQSGETVLFPILEKQPGATRGLFEEQRRRESLPRHDLIGGIALLQEPDREGAKRLLHSKPSIHTVLYPESVVEGEFRTRRFVLLAGENTTRTQYIEYGMKYDIDLSVAYFSARLSNERQRIRELVQNGELVLDMFAGVGPFAITISERAALVFACDINPGAVTLMRRNIARNKRKNIIPMLMDATRLPGVLPFFFDRVIMNLPLSVKEHIPSAVRLCKQGGVMHVYALQSSEGEYRPLLQQLTRGEIIEHYVRSYSPALHHAVYDVEVIKG